MQQRGVHPLAFARDLALEQRRQNAQGGVEARAHVGHGQPRAHRATALVPGHRHQPAHALDDLVKPRALGVRPVLAKARDAGQHQARVDFGERLVVQAQLGLDIGAPVFNQHVGVFDQAHQDLVGARLFEVQRHGPLVAVDVLKIPAFAVGGKHGLVGVHTRRRLDAHHIGAKVGEHAHTVGAGAHAREVQDTKTGQGRGGLDFGHEV